MNEAEDKLLTLEDAAVVLGTGVRFTRRLVAERRIRFVKVRRHVRIPRSALVDFIDAATVQAAPAAR
jgi:excisionase family DNA binding protein